MSQMMNDDALSVPQIAYRQREVEGELQSAPRLIKDAAEHVVFCQRTLNTARAKAAMEAGEAYLKAKTVAEKDRLLWSATVKEWEDLQLAEIALNYARDTFKASQAELMSLGSRLKAANESDRAHARYGGG